MSVSYLEPGQCGSKCPITAAVHRCLPCWRTIGHEMAAVIGNIEENDHLEGCQPMFAVRVLILQMKAAADAERIWCEWGEEFSSGTDSIDRKSVV